MSASVTAADADSGRVRAPDTDAIRLGGYAQREVDITSARQEGDSPELSLAAPFGPLFSALFQGRHLRVRSLSLTYVSVDQLGAVPMFSAKLTELREGGEARLSLLVFRGARVCVRGEAVVALVPANGETAR